MSIPWRFSAEVFEQILDRHGVAAGACTMEAAWAAFAEFMQIPVEGIESPEDDGDGFIVEWGVWEWSGNRPALSLGRLLAVNEYSGLDASYRHLQYWKVEFQACFAEDSAWADLHLRGGDSSYDHAAIGEPRADALTATRRSIDQDPLLSAMWQSHPIDIEVTLDRAG
ncbi:hypothetical protein ACIQK9_21870 [Streptomyces hydrogenans]|uniref:hypothetical protein n=1 Tax=Streptomyces hydrogenans TaxID=1873719 RepID=UPI0038286FF9